MLLHKRFRPPNRRRPSAARWRLWFIGALLVTAALGLAVEAAAQAAAGAITGTLVDSQGGALPGVTLTLRNADTGVTRTIVSEADGQYRFPALAPGNYEVKAELEGFATVEVKDLRITIGLEIRRNITLAPAGLQESLTVSAQAAVVETTRSDVASVVTLQQIESLPVFSRQPIALALLLPGTSQDNVRTRRFSTNIGAGALTSNSTMVFADGGQNWTQRAGESRTDFPQVTIQEFKVNVSQATAEFGGTTGGVVTIATKNGTNTFSGEAFEYFRNKSLNAMNVFEQQQHDQLGFPKPDFRRHQFGFGLGGPIVKNKVHFFVALERTDQTEYFTVNTGKPQFYSALEGAFPNPYQNYNFFVRPSFQLNQNQSLFVRYTYMIEHFGCESCGGTNSAFSSSRLDFNPRDAMVIGHTWLISSNAVNEIRSQGFPARTNAWTVPTGADPWYELGNFASQRFAKTTSIYRFPSLNWGSSSTGLQGAQAWEIKDEFSWTVNKRGSHTFKTGGGFIHLPGPSEQTGDPPGKGTWTFSTDQFFDGSPAALAALKSPTQFTATVAGWVRNERNQWGHAYFQDEWRPRPNVTLNLGVRYDKQWKIFNEYLTQDRYPKPLPYVDFASRGDSNNVAPRLGFVWDLRSDGKSVVRGGYGRYFQFIMNGATTAEMAALLSTNIIIRNPSYPDPYQGKDPLTFASTALPNISIVANNLENPWADTYSLGISKELTSALAINIDGIYTKTQHYWENVNINTPDPVTKVRPLTTWGNITQAQSIGWNNYRALLVRLDKRFANHYQYLISYTLAKTDGNLQAVGNTTGAMVDFYNPQQMVGPALSDRRHSLVASGSVVLPAGITLGAVWTIRSTMPFNATAGVDLNGDGATTDYVPGTTRNMGNRDNATLLAAVNAYRAANSRAPIAASQLDNNYYNATNVRASKTFDLGGARKLELIGQVFDVFGNSNLLPPGGTGWTTNALSDSFGRILQAHPKQQAELAVRFMF